MHQTYPQPVAAPRRGKGLIIAGSVLLAVSVLLGIVGFVIVARSFDFADLDRDVAISGSTDRLVPGDITFSVLDPLGGGEGLMTVGIATSDPTPGTTCSITDEDGTEVSLTSPRSGEEMLDPQGRYSDYLMYGTARLEPGEYVAACTMVEEPGSAGTNSFTIGRVFGYDDISENLAGFVWGLVLWGTAALLFVIGVVLLIIGLVQRSRSKRDAAMSGGWPGTGYPQPAPYPTTQGPGPYGPGSYGPTGPGQTGAGPGVYDPGGQAHGGYGQPPAPQPMPPATWGDPQQPYAPPTPTAPAPPEPWAPPPGWTPPGEQAPPPHEPPAPAAPNSPPPEPTPDDGASGWTVPPSKNT